MLKLHYAPTSCSTASHIALEESGAVYEATFAKLYKPEVHEAYRAEVTPRGTVPALDVDGVVFTENVAILGYIARRFPEARLLPAAPLQEAICISHMAWMASSVHITRRQAFVPRKFAKGDLVEPALAEAGRAAFWANLQALDALLRPGPWVMGDQFTVADCYAAVFYGWGLTDGYPVAELSAYTAFKERLVQRPAARRVLERERNVLVADLAPTSAV